MNIRRFISINILSFVGYFLFILFCTNLQYEYFDFDSSIFVVYILLYIFYFEFYFRNKRTISSTNLLDLYKNNNIHSFLIYIGIIFLLFLFFKSFYIVLLSIIVFPIIMQNKNYITTKILSLSGYLLFAYTLFFNFIEMPKAHELMELGSKNDFMDISYLAFYYKVVVISYILCTIINIFAIFEYIKKKNQAKQNTKFYSFLYWFGYLLLIFSPILCIILLLIF